MPLYTIDADNWVLKNGNQHIKCENSEEATQVMEMLDVKLCNGCYTNDVIMRALKCSGSNSKRY